jgi:hypothetical protein
MKLLVMFAGLSVWGQVVGLDIADVPAGLRAQFPADFGGYLKSVESDTARRIEEGEWEHAIYYILQSKRFTSLDAIEPAISARDLHRGDAPNEVPRPVQARMEAFLEAQSGEERFLYFRRLAGAGRAAALKRLKIAYLRAMQFLYEKEFVSQGKDGNVRRSYIAGLYQTRAHSTDTNIDASFGVSVGLSALKDLRPRARLERVLLIGPGLDFAPRTGLRDDRPPGSLQPFVLASLLPDSKIVCADANPRVVDFLGRFLSSPQTSLTLDWAVEDAEQREFLSKLGGGKLVVSGERKRAVSVRRLNILTERFAETFDLAVATNVFVYFSDQELILALSGIRAMLRPGGFLLHNDLRASIDGISGSLAMPPIHARMIRLSEKRQLYDSVVIHERGER